MTHIDSDAFVAWEAGRFDLVGWLADEPEVAFCATAWQEMTFGVFAWESGRATKRQRSLEVFEQAAVIAFEKRHAVQAAKIEAELKSNKIGIADCQIAACALEEDAELLTFNVDHFSRVPGLRLAKL
jgi:predicted nucleic acid-binding protein